MHIHTCKIFQNTSLYITNLRWNNYRNKNYNCDMILLDDCGLPLENIEKKIIYENLY